MLETRNRHSEFHTERMRQVLVKLGTRRITGWDSFHTLKDVFDFLDFDGRNLEPGWIA